LGKATQKPNQPRTVLYRWMTPEEAKASADERLRALSQNEAALKQRESALTLREDKLAQREEAVEEIYKVGPGKPPLETRFKKGTTGNPGGRPKIKSLRAMFLKVANRRIGSTVGEEDGIDPETSKLEAAMHAMFESARQGDNVAMKRVLELTRAYIPEPGATGPATAKHGARALNDAGEGEIDEAEDGIDRIETFEDPPADDEPRDGDRLSDTPENEGGDST